MEEVLHHVNLKESLKTVLTVGFSESFKRMATFFEDILCKKHIFSAIRELSVFTQGVFKLLVNPIRLL